MASARNPEHLDPATCRRLAAVLARTSSASPAGERLAALTAAERILGGHGLCLEEVVASALRKPESRMAIWRRHLAKEASFIRRLAEPQLTKLAAILRHAGLG
jgi:hypothetical protein